MRFQIAEEGGTPDVVRYSALVRAGPSGIWPAFVGSDSGRTPEPKPNLGVAGLAITGWKPVPPGAERLCTPYVVPYNNN